MTYRIAFPLLALAVASGCSGRDATGPMTTRTSPSAAVSSSRNADDNDAENSPRSGALHVTKECSAYTGAAGSFCTITFSNLTAIKVGTRVVYANALVGTFLDTDVTLVPPRGNSVAFGHVVLNLAPTVLSGGVTISGGTGRFKRFHATAVVTHLIGPNWAWDGTYRFSDDGED